jgi:hypothetical protein
MNEFIQKPSAPRDGASPAPETPYEPPRVERLLTQKDLEREVLYGGPTTTPIEW